MKKQQIVSFCLMVSSVFVVHASGSSAGRKLTQQQARLPRVARRGNAKKLAELLSAGNVDVNMPYARNKAPGSPVKDGERYVYTPLLEVTARGKDCPNMVQLLLNARANTGVVSDAGWTPLMYACAQGHVETVRLLLDVGCALGTACSDTPLTIARETPLGGISADGDDQERAKNKAIIESLLHEHIKRKIPEAKEDVMQNEGKKK